MTTETWHRVAWQEGNPRTGHSVDHATARAAVHGGTVGRVTGPVIEWDQTEGAA